MARASRVRSGDARRCKRCMGNRSAAKEPVHILRQLKKFSATASRISLYGTCSGDWCCGRRSPGPVHTALLSCCYPYGHPGCCHRSSPALPPGRVSHPDRTGDLCNVCVELFAWVLSGKVMVNQVFRSPLSASAPLVDSPLYAVFPY